MEDFHTYHVGENGVWVHNAGRSYSTAKEFEDSLNHMDSNERVAVIKQEAKAVAEKNGFEKNARLSKINKRDVYYDPKKKIFILLILCTGDLNTVINVGTI